MNWNFIINFTWTKSGSFASDLIPILSVKLLHSKNCGTMTLNNSCVIGVSVWSHRSTFPIEFGSKLNSWRTKIRWKIQNVQQNDLRVWGYVLLMKYSLLTGANKNIPVYDIIFLQNNIFLFVVKLNTNCTIFVNTWHAHSLFILLQRQPKLIARTQRTCL